MIIRRENCIRGTSGIDAFTVGSESTLLFNRVAVPTCSNLSVPSVDQSGGVPADCYHVSVARKELNVGYLVGELICSVVVAIGFQRVERKLGVPDVGK